MGHEFCCEVVELGPGCEQLHVGDLVVSIPIALDASGIHPVGYSNAYNGGYAEIREQMVDRGITPQAVDLHRPDVPALARAIGAYGVEAKTVEELGPLVADALTMDRPTVIYHRVG